MTELQAVTKPMLDAWVAWEPGYDPEPPLTPKQSAFVRHAFYAGWFASQASPPPLDEVPSARDWLTGMALGSKLRASDFGTFEGVEIITVESAIEAMESYAALSSCRIGTADE